MNFRNERTKVLTKIEKNIIDIQLKSFDYFILLYYKKFRKIISEDGKQINISWVSYKLSIIFVKLIEE